MWPRRFFAARFFAPRYFPQSQGAAPPAIAIDNRTGTGAAHRNASGTGRAPNA